MSTQQRNSELVNLLRPDFQARNEPQFAASRLISSFQTFAGTRGVWYAGNTDDVDNIPDLTGQGRTMYSNITSPAVQPDLNVSNAINMCQRYQPSTHDRHYRLDEPGLSITGTEPFTPAGRSGITCGGWFRFAQLPSVYGNSMGLIGKYDAGQQSYALYAHNTANTFRFLVNSGAATSLASLADAVVTTDRWWYILGTWHASTYIRIDVGDSRGNWYSTESTSSIIASIADTTSGFYIGNYQATNTTNLDGWWSIATLCVAHQDLAQSRWVWEQTWPMFEWGV